MPARGAPPKVSSYSSSTPLALRHLNFDSLSDTPNRLRASVDQIDGLNAEAAHQAIERRAIDAERGRRGIAIALRGVDRATDAQRGGAIEELLKRALR